MSLVSFASNILQIRVVSTKLVIEPGAGRASRLEYITPILVSPPEEGLPQVAEEVLRRARKLDQI